MIATLRQSAAVVIAALALAGCAYEQFNIIVGRDFYTGHIMTHYTDVEVGDKRIVMKPGARLAIKSGRLTQSVSQFDIEVVEGDGLIAYVRTVPHDFDTTKGIALRYSTSGSWARNDRMEIVPIEHNADAGLQTLKIYSDGDLIRFDVGCRVLHEQTTTLPGTEYIIFETLPGSTVEIRSVKFFLLNE